MGTAADIFTSVGLILAASAFVTVTLALVGGFAVSIRRPRQAFPH